MEGIDMNHFKTLAAAALLACASVHVAPAHAQDDIFKASFIRANLIKGKTTADQVLAKFGEPAHQEMTDSSETWVYQRGANAQAQPQKKGGGLGGFMGLVKGVAQTAYEIAPEKMGSGAARLYSGADRVERTANTASRMGGAAYDGGHQASAGGGASVLQVDFNNGVVSSFRLR